MKRPARTAAHATLMVTRSGRAQRTAPRRGDSIPSRAGPPRYPVGLPPKAYSLDMGDLSGKIDQETAHYKRRKEGRSPRGEERKRYAGRWDQADGDSHVQEGLQAYGSRQAEGRVRG